MKLLIVDDSKVQRKLLSKLLANSNDVEEVEVATDGESALGMLENSQYDCVLTDYVMPGINGAQLVERIRKQPDLLRLPVVIYSSGVDEKILIDAVKNGASKCYIGKFNVELLVSKIKEAISLEKLKSI